ncbi:MAG: hypothetical protein ACK5KM_00330, partial [Hyphomicrobiaceae bacterium]
RGSCCHLPFGRADLTRRGPDILCRADLSYEIGGVAADTFGCHLHCLDHTVEVEVSMAWSSTTKLTCFASIC